MIVTFEEKCSDAWKRWKESIDEGSKFSSPGYADDPRAFLGFISETSTDSCASYPWEEAFTMGVKRTWPEAGLSESAIGLKAITLSPTHEGITDSEKWVCDLFTVHGSGLDPSTGHEVLILNTIDADRKVRQIRLPRGIIVGNDAQFASYCADRGFNVTQNKALRGCLKAVLAALKGKRIQMTERTGWIGKGSSFVLPSGEIIGDSSKRVVFTADKTLAANTVVKSGNFDAWKETIEKTVPNNSRLELALCAGLYSPLMRYSGDPRCVIFNIYGESSLGKTSSGYVFGSVWGGDPTRPLRYAHSWNQTYNSLNVLAGSYSSIGLSLDEIQHCPSPDIAYSFSEGEDKGRLDANSKQKARRRWECIAWSTGEKRMEVLVSENYKTKDSGVQSGREARFFDIPVTGTGSIKGVVESLNGFKNPEALIAEVADGTRENFGHAGPALVRAIIDYVNEHGEEALKAKFGKASSDMLAALGLAEDANPIVKRVAKSFAQVGAAGIIAAEFSIIPNDPENLTDGVVKCFQDWLAQRGSQHFTLAEIKPVLALRDFIQSKRHLFLDPDRPDDFKGQEIVGYTKAIRGKQCYLLTHKSWEAAQRQGRAGDLTKTLDQRGLLVKQSESRLKVLVRVKGLNGVASREWFHAVSADILNIDDSGAVLTDGQTEIVSAEDDLSGKPSRGPNVKRTLRTIKGGKR